jgi:hypothetical protein
MTKFAEKTIVSAERSRAEIEATLQRYGATAFGYGWDTAAAVVMFEIAHRRIRFRLPLPDRNDEEFTRVLRNQHSWVWATPAQRQAKWEQACRQSWRALALVIKAKLEAVESGITTVEQEFMAHIVLPSGDTVGEWALPQIAVAYQRNEMPALLPGAAP